MQTAMAAGCLRGILLDWADGGEGLAQAPVLAQPEPGSFLF